MTVELCVILCPNAELNISEEQKITGSKMSLCEEREEEDIHYQNKRTASPEPSCVSMRSNVSMIQPPKFSDGPVTFNPR